MSALSWNAWSAIGQLVGAAGVIVSLIYLAVQIRQNTRSVRAASFHEITDSFNQLNLLLAGDAELASLSQRGLGDLGALQPGERVRFDFMSLSLFRVFETLFYQSRQRTAERRLWEAEVGTMRTLLASPGLREWWRSNPLSFTPEFREFVDGLIQEASG